MKNPAFKELLVDNCEFNDLPAEWLAVRTKQAQIVTKAFEFGLRTIEQGQKDLDLEFTDQVCETCHMHGTIYRPLHPMFLTILPVQKVVVGFEPKDPNLLCGLVTISSASITLKLLLTEWTDLEIKIVLTVEGYKITTFDLHDNRTDLVVHYVK